MYKYLVVITSLLVVRTSGFTYTFSLPPKNSLATSPVINDSSRRRHSNRRKGYDRARVGEGDPTSSKAKTTSLSSSFTSIIPREVLTSFLPACLGFYKSEYGVSYGYGLATACTALSILRSRGSSLLTTLHAASLMFYGVRLSVFLAFRLAISTRNQDLAKKIEDRAMEKSRLSRLPFILSCGLMYYGLVAPLWFTSKLQDTSFQVSILMKGLIGMTWFGFSIAALGDFTKTYFKQFVRKDEYALVTEGVYSILRHPNYTGEIIGWTANALCGLVAAFTLTTSESAAIIGLPMLLTKIGVTMYGWSLIVFVLLRATTTLEKRQGEDYGKDVKYKDWIKSTWSGWTLSEKNKEEVVTDYKIELDKDQTQSDGAGI